MALIGLSHLIHYLGIRRYSKAIRFEKIVFVLAALAIMAATFGRCIDIVDMIDQPNRASRDYTEHDMSGLSGLVIYPLGLVLSVFIILVVLPRPIRGPKKNV